MGYNSHKKKHGGELKKVIDKLIDEVEKLKGRVEQLESP